MSRLVDAWRELLPAQRRAALASLGLFLSMLLPWYDKTDTVIVHGAAKATQTSLSAYQAFSFVEAAVLLVSGGILAMLFARAERRQFQLPGGDGLIVMIAGGWTAILIFYRLFDKPGLQGNEQVTSTVGVEWGIFIALLLALALVAAGARMRAEERPEPPLRRARATPPRLPLEPPSVGEADDPTIVRTKSPPDIDATVVDPVRARRRRPTPVPAPPREPGAAGQRSRYPPAPPEQLSFEDPPARSD